MPLAISSAAFVATWCYLFSIVVIKTPSTLLGVIVCAVLAIPITLIALYVKLLTNTVLVRKRLWFWLRDKFDSWEEATQWIHKTDANELDWIAKQPDGSWEPDVIHGGTSSE